MTTNTAGSTARRYQSQQITYLRKDIVFGNTGAQTVGIVPEGAVILRGLSGVQINVAFNAGTSNVLDIGTTADDDLYGTDLALGTRAFVALDENVDYRITADTTITATPALSGTAATAGAATVVIAYII